MYVLFSVTLYARAYRAAHMAEKERGWPISFTGRFLRHMALLFSFHERSDGCGEQKTLSRLKKRAKIIVSNLSPADE